MSITWHNDTRRLADLIPWEHNPKQLTKEQGEALRVSIDKFGLALPLLISPDDDIYDGHQRQALMEQMSDYGPDAVVDVRVSSRQLTWDEQRELVIRLRENQAGWDFDALGNIYDVEELSTWGFPEWKIEELMPEAEPDPVDDPGPQVDKAEELRAKWGVESGQMWQLGEHRIICGDCTDPAVVERVMGGEKVEMVFTDPPYGVAVGDKNKWLHSIGQTRIGENLQNDTGTEEELAQLLSSAFDNAISVQNEGGAWYVAAPEGPPHLIFGEVLKVRGIWRQTIQWVKNKATFSPTGVCYHWQCEPIFFGWLPNGAHRCYGDRTETTAWMIDRPTKSPEHPTMKPIELMERGIRKSSKTNEIVLDSFLGSGSTLIACERLNRRCRGIEISPAYIAVTLERWADMTGDTPHLVKDTHE